MVTLYQRGGPSTGLPTRTEQGDLMFAIRGGHGEYPRLVLASGDILDAFLDAQKALAWAWRYQMVVVHLLDKFLASSGQSLPKEVFKVLNLDGEKRMPPKEAFGPYERYAPSEDGISPFVPLGTPGGFYWMTSDEHDPLGHITEDPIFREAQMEKRMQKLLTARKEIPQEDQYTLYRDGEVLVLGFGAVKGTMLEALDHLEGGVLAPPPPLALSRDRSPFGGQEARHPGAQLLRPAGRSGAAGNPEEGPPPGGEVQRPPHHPGRGGGGPEGHQGGAGSGKAGP